MNSAYVRNFYAMSDSAVHEELEELEQDNTVKYFPLLVNRSQYFFRRSKWDRISHWKGNLSGQGRNANEEGLFWTKLNFFSYLSRIKLLDVKEREKREKGDQGKQSHRFDPQFYLQIVILIEHGIERGLVANDGCDHIAVRMCCFSHAFLIASCSLITTWAILTLRLTYNFFIKSNTPKSYWYCRTLTGDSF